MKWHMYAGRARTDGDNEGLATDCVKIKMTLMQVRLLELLNLSFNIAEYNDS